MATSLNSSSKPRVDPWDEQTNIKPISRKPVVAPVVRDDWEDDDDDENDAIKETSPVTSSSSRVQSPSIDAEENRKIWEAANNKVAAPMPTLVASRTGSVMPPPAAAFQPTLRILKRPESSSPSQSSPTTTPPPPGESIQEREARYAAARERIFGSENTGNNQNASPPKANNVKVIREPKAPEQGQSPGFRGRGAKTSSSTRPPARS